MGRGQSGPGVKVGRGQSGPGSKWAGVKVGRGQSGPGSKWAGVKVDQGSKWAWGQSGSVPLAAADLFFLALHFV